MAVIVEHLDKSRLPKKRKRYEDAAPGPLATLPAEWRDLLAQWLKLGGNSRWDTLIKKAGLAQKGMAETLLDWLLNHGWAVVYEERRHGEWWPCRVVLQQQKIMRQQLGLPDDEALARQWQSLLAGLMIAAEANPDLQPALDHLDSMPVSRAIARGELIQSLIRWKADQRTGSYRDFSLFARDATKTISSSEWQWLESSLDLANYGIQPHTQLLYISADLTLTGAAGSLMLAQAQPFAAFTPASILQLTQVQAAQPLQQWICVENLTSFERTAAKRQPDTAVLWLPGFPPGWWQQSVSHLLQHCPAPLLVACDPDPAGIRIAQIAIDLWRSHGLPAQPWRMQVDDLNHCKQQLPLTDLDRQQLVSITQQSDLHPDLAMLARFMQQHQYKAEQESYL
ncbi:Protein of unknown function C-terminus [Methylophilus rhizosphaerae]|uniref:DUF2399 domain-containing protein n=1 Tax=Methylophilus rhizosphaerae TaxID=492660 RepID=A0A1G8ZMF8_9PROT|nr:DUF2399 domain-containing protein [Methylophilus rhizosphaerae]SDK16231.1 Protein of unknown function C-terminus [Methylophilus rhizosphaerae]